MNTVTEYGNSEDNQNDFLEERLYARGRYCYYSYKALNTSCIATNLNDIINKR